MIPSFKAHQIEQDEGAQDNEEELLKEIDKNFNPADDTIDQRILEEITGNKAAVPTLESNKKESKPGIKITGNNAANET